MIVLSRIILRGSLTRQLLWKPAIKGTKILLKKIVIWCQLMQISTWDFLHNWQEVNLALISLKQIAPQSRNKTHSLPSLACLYWNFLPQMACRLCSATIGLNSQDQQSQSFLKPAASGQVTRNRWLIFSFEHGNHFVCLKKIYLVQKIIFKNRWRYVLAL